MNEYVITRHNSNADGGARHPAVTMGVVEAPNHREAMNRSHQLFNCDSCQWFEADSVKRLKQAKVNAARRVWEYKHETV